MALYTADQVASLLDTSGFDFEGGFETESGSETEGESEIEEDPEFPLPQQNSDSDEDELQINQVSGSQLSSNETPSPVPSPYLSPPRAPFLSPTPSPVPSPTPSPTFSPSRGQDLHDHTAHTSTKYERKNKYC